MYYELQPAYGKDYKTKAEVIDAFTKGKDFQGDYQMRFRYCSITDFKPGEKVLLRYKRLTMVTSYTVTGNELAFSKTTTHPSVTPSA